MTTITIAKVQFPAWKESVDKINARAKRLRFAGGIDYTITGESTEKYEIGDIETSYRAYKIDVEIGYLQHEGWDVVAVVKVDRDTAITTYHSMPGYEEIISADTYEPGVCHECQTSRKRNQVIIVQNAETGELRQVGGSCIKDYVGWKPTMARLDLLLGLREFIAPVPHDRCTIDPVTVLAVAHDVVSSNGYVSRDNATDTKPPTASIVRECLAQDDYKCGIDPGRAIELAEGTREWILSGENADNYSEYMTNLRAIAASDEISERHVGILASAVAAQHRAEKREAEKESVRVSSEWVGEVKERRDFDLTIDSIRTVSGQYGDTTIYSLSDADGSRFKWFASRAALGDYEGVNVTVKATVKKHAEWDGVKETHLTRAKLVRGTVVGFDADPHWCGGREREYSVGV